MSKESFILYMSFNEAISQLTLKEKGMLLDAIYRYHSDDPIPDLPKTTSMVFSIMKNQFERDHIKYQKKCEINRENGEKGGRPPQKPKITERLFDKNGNNPTQNINNPNDDDNDSDSDSDDETLNVNENDSDDDDVSDVGAEFTEIVNFYKSSSSSFRDIVCNDDYSKKQYYVMLKKHGIEKIRLAITKASESWYCTGYNERGMITPLSWILQPKFFEGLLTEKYANRGEIPEFDREGNKLAGSETRSARATRSAIGAIKSLNDRMNYGELATSDQHANDAIR